MSKNSGQEQYTIKEVLFQSESILLERGLRSSDGMKVILKSSTTWDRSDLLHGLENEFSLTRSLHNPHIFKPFQLEEPSQGPRLVYADEDLYPIKQLIPGQGFVLDDFFPLALKLSYALDEIHQEGISHKGIDSRHIMASSSLDRVQLGGFNQSTSIKEEVISLYPFHGESPFFLYISPEQTGRINRKIDYRCDFYSLGLCFYEFLCGNLPFNDGDKMELIYSHIAREAQALHLRKNSIPLEVSQLVQKMLQKDPENRYQSAKGLIYDLEQLDELYRNNDSTGSFQLASRDFSTKFIIKQGLYGREPELFQMREIFKTVEQGDRGSCFIEGRSGVGKSFLVNEIQREIFTNKTLFCSGKFEYLKMNTPYSAISSALGDLIRLIISEHKESLQTWEELLKQRLGLNASVLMEILPDLEWILGEVDEAPPLGGQETQNRLYSTFQEFIGSFHDLGFPLVMFLDDIQWIDQASLGLIQKIILNPQCRSFLLITAHRSEEVDALHRASRFMEKINKEIPSITLKLKPLKYKALTQWISASVKQSQKYCAELSKLIQQKTNGNPFFVSSFLMDLFHREFLYSDGRGTWDWDYKKILAAKPTDNVTELMIQNLNTLSEASKDILIKASCIGRDFPLDILTAITDLKDQSVVKLLQPCLEAGMVSCYQNNYRFIHDKIQEACYSLLEEEHRARLHFRIGKELESFVDKDRDYQLERVEHLNEAKSLLNSQELQHLMELNYRVALDIKGTAAFRSSTTFFEQAAKLLPPEAWQNNFSFTQELYLNWAEAQYMSVHYDEAESLIQTLLDHSNTVIERLPIHQLQLVFYNNMKNYHQALDLFISSVSDLGIAFPGLDEAQESINEVPHQQFLELWQNRGKSLSEMTDPVELNIMRFLSEGILPFWVTNPPLCKYLSYLMVNRSLEKGISTFSSLGFSMLGSILAAKSSTLDIGYELATIALELPERFNDPFRKTLSIYMFYNHVYFWRNPLKWNEEKLMEAYHWGVETGNNQWASYSLNHYSMRSLMAGTPLEEAKRRYDQLSPAQDRLKQLDAYTFFNPPRQAVECLLGNSGPGHRLEGEYLQEERDIEEFYKVDHFAAVGLTDMSRLFCRVVMAKYKDALGIVEREDFDFCIRSSTGLFFNFIGLFFQALVLCKNYEKNKERLKQIEDLEEEFKELSELQWNNFAPMYLLVRAEHAVIKKNHREAMECFDRAIEEADRGGFLHYQALGFELAAQFYLDWGRERIARLYLQQALNSYSKWNCWAKVKQMENQYSFLVSHDRPGLKNKNRSYDDLDYSSIQESVQTISGEIRLEDLQRILLRIISKNAGAKRALLIVSSSETAVLSASYDLNNEEDVSLIHEPLRGTKELPEGLMAYILRSGKKVLLDNACEKGIYRDDPYVKLHGTKSILAMPIKHKETLLGAVYLENDSSTGVFTENRVRTLDILLSQAAISLENASLYADRLQAEEELRESEEKYRRLTENAPAMIYRMSLPDGRYLFVSNAATEVFGYAPQVFYDSPMLIREAIHPDFAEYFRREWAQLIQGKMSPTYEYKIIDGVGRTKWIFQKNVLVKDSQGNPIAIEGIVNDITERKNTEGKLRELQNYLSNIIDSMPSILVGINNIGQVNQWNSMAEDYSDIPRNQAIGKDIYALLPQLDDHRAEISGSLETRDIYRNPSKSVEHRGVIQYQSLTVYPLQGNSLGGAVIRIDDVTKQYLADEKINQTRKMDAIGQLAGGIAHDFNNMLTGIMSAAQLLEDSQGLNLEEKEYIDLIMQSSSRAADLTSKLLRFGRKAKKEYQVLQVHGLLEDTLSILKRTLNKNINVTAGLNAAESQIKGDSSALQSLFMNLLINASHAMPEGGVIDIHSSNLTLDSSYCDQSSFSINPGEYLEIRIADTGTGISPRDLARIFEPFFTTKEVGKGTGLGLSAVYGTIQDHEGLIEVDSTLGRGTTFRIRLPLAPSIS